MKISALPLIWLVCGAMVMPVGISSVFAVQSVPLAPTQLNATAVTGTQIFLIWNPPTNSSQSGVTGYKIETSPSCTDTFQFLANTTSTSFLSANLTKGTCYQFRVDAVNAAGFSTPSNVASARTLTVPSAPTGLSALAVSSSQIHLGWNAPNSTGGTVITGYEIKRQNSCTGNFVAVTNTTNSSTVYSDTGLAASTCYQYKVSAINAIGVSIASNNSTATTLSSVTVHVPSAPGGLAVTAASNASLSLTWNPPSNNGGSPITGYLIQRNGTIIVNNTFSNKTSYTDANLKPSHEQTYQVAAWNSAGQSPLSNSTSGITLAISGNSTNQTGSNLGQMISDLMHKRNQLRHQERSEIVAIIHDCHAQVKNSTSADKKQIMEDCKAKVKQVKAKYHDLLKQLEEQIKELKAQFKALQKHDDDDKPKLPPSNGTKHDDDKPKLPPLNGTKHDDDKESDHMANQTKDSGKDSEHFEDAMKHLGKSIQAPGNPGHKHGKHGDG